MGYDSRFSGSLTPSKPIPEELIKRINDLCDLMVLSKGDTENDCGGEPGDVVPEGSNMHGYDIVEDTFKVQRLLKPYGIVLNGEIYRTGESDGDFEKIEVVDGKVYDSYGEIVYKNRRQVTVKDVTRYYIVVKSGGSPIGWLGCRGLLEKRYPLVKPERADGKPLYDKPPLGAFVTKRRKEAQEIVDGLNGRVKRVYEVVSREDRL